MQIDVPYRVQYQDELGEHWSDLYPTYQTASIAAALLHEQGAKIMVIFRDAGSYATDRVGSQLSPPGWLRRLGFG